MIINLSNTSHMYGAVRLGQAARVVSLGNPLRVAICSRPFLGVGARDREAEYSADKFAWRLAVIKTLGGGFNQRN